MICSSRELGIGDDHDGIIVLPADAGKPGDDAFDVLGLREEVIEFEINPDRAYALSLRGIAREAALAFGAPFRDPALRETPAPNGDGYPVLVDDPVGCPVFVARTVTGFDPSAPTPAWLAERITQAGMRPISLAVDITNYVMLETGRPIHGYDLDKLQGPIRVRRAVEGERMTTLDSAQRTLSSEDLVVTDDSGIIGLGGVMGGETTEMSATTTNVLIEAAHWDAVSMFRTGKRHKITSEAGKRNERGVDPTICPAAADRVVELLVEHGGGTPGAGVTVVGTPPEQPPITIGYDLPARISGIDIDSETVVANLQAIGATVDADADGVTVTPPPWRPDVTDPFDLVEEVVRIVGYDQVPSVLPREAAGRGLTRPQRLRRRIGRTLAGAGCVEVVSFPFVGDATFDALGLPADDVLRTTVRARQPAVRRGTGVHDDPAPRRTQGRRAQHRTRRSGRGPVRDRDRGVPGRPRPGADLRRRPAAGRGRPAEAFRRAARCSPSTWRSSWPVSGSGPAGGAMAATADWSDAVGLVRRLATELGVAVDVRQGSQMPWHPGRCAVFSIGDTELGHAGELHPQVCAEFGLPVRSAAVEIDLDVLMAHARRGRAGTGVLVVPGGQGGRRTGGRRRRPGRRRSRRRCAKAPASCSSRCGSSTSTPVSRSATVRSRSPSR